MLSQDSTFFQGISVILAPKSKEKKKNLSSFVMAERDHRQGLKGGDDL